MSSRMHRAGQAVATAATWINQLLKPAQARHVIVTAMVAVLFAHLPLDGLHWLVADAWLRALWAGVLVSCLELLQGATQTGKADWNDVAANFSGAGLIALATLA